MIGGQMPPLLLIACAFMIPPAVLPDTSRSRVSPPAKDEVNSNESATQVNRGGKPRSGITKDGGTGLDVRASAFSNTSFATEIAVIAFGQPA